MGIYWGCTNYRKLSYKERTDEILKRVANREYFFGLAAKMLCVAQERGIRLIMENPWSQQTYLKANFILPPTMIDNNRRLRGGIISQNLLLIGLSTVNRHMDLPSNVTRKVSEYLIVDLEKRPVSARKRGQ